MFTFPIGSEKAAVVRTSAIEPLEARTLLAAHPNLLADLNPTPAGSNPGNFVPFGNKAIFDAQTDDHQPGLWITDGTPHGTRFLQHVTSVSLPSGTVQHNGILYFIGETFGPETWRENFNLWRTDGTAGGTFKVSDAQTGRIWDLGNGTFLMSGPYNGTQNEGLWRSDGTAAGTQQISDVFIHWYSASSVVFDHKLYFIRVSQYEKTAELWTSDGTAAGTKLLVDFNAFEVTSGQHVEELAVAGGKLFVSTGGKVGNLYVSGDGTAANLTLLMSSPTQDEGPYNMTGVQETLYFQALIPNSSRVWRTDGTPQGTVPLPANVPVFPDYIGALGSTLFFHSGNDLLKTDGTAAGTQIIFSFDTPIPTEYPDRSSAVIDGFLYFTDYQNSTGYELWRTDGTTAGTMLVADLNPGPASSVPGNITALDHKILAAANAGPSGDEPVAVDPKHSGKARVEILHDFPGTQDSSPKPVLSIGRSLFFIASDSEYQYSLFKTDGTASGTVKLASDVRDYATAAIDFDGVLFFIANGALWKSDGTAAGTTKLAGGWNLGAPVSWLNIVNGTLYYIYQDHYEGYESASSLYALASPNGTARVVTSVGQSAPLPLVLGGLIYFNYVRYSPLRYQWYVTDGTTTTAVSGPDPAAVAAPSPTPPFSDSLMIGSTRYYAFDDGKHGTELWMDDGKHKKLVDDIYKGSASSSPDGLALVNGQLMFAATNATFGRELFVLRIEPAGRLATPVPSQPIPISPLDGLGRDESPNLAAQILG